MTTSLRKIEHLQICANEPVEAHVSAGFDDVHLIHCALPEIDKDEALALAAEHLGIGVGVGSQRAALENPEQEETFRVVRDCAPHAFVYANIGVVQLTEYGIDGVEHAIEMIDADAIAIHLNFLQEAIQPGLSMR